MPIPPILDVLVVWHPDDHIGEDVLAQLADHFHGATFAGLAGGAVEVYGRSTGWESDGSAPRPLGIAEPLAEILPSAQFNAIVPVIGPYLVRAVDREESWERYIDSIAQFKDVDRVGIFPLLSLEAGPIGHRLTAALGSIQALPADSWRSPATLGRELCQAITQHVEATEGIHRPIRVFVSYTRHDSLEESDQEGPALYRAVCEIITQTRLSLFFDAHSLQAGTGWENELDVHAADSALLMIRTDKYAGREWAQREVLAAKRHDLPMVGMYALTAGEERGSFLMDHIPSVPCNVKDPHMDIERALNRLVDEALKRALWKAQTVYLVDDGFDWMPVHAPEPVTLAPWLGQHKSIRPNDKHVWIMHPDPPLGPKELQLVVELCSLAGFNDEVDVVTPRTFAARGGRLRR